ncbi:MAG TPA: arylsulfatase, partial [Planctomycetes bacterium]|nr:arylsulfatase [Planctomycetota bacterium]
MNKSNLLISVVFLLGFSSLEAGEVSTAKRPPNIVIVFTDDQGWGDLSCYGSKQIPTPHIDRLAAEGMRFTDFYVSQPVCSASRSSLVSGCYANRVGISGALAPSSRIGLDPQEMTIAEVVKPLGYATACYGKWHLGHLPPFLPTQQGFDEYCGIPYSNDMWPGHPESPKAWPPLPWYEQDQ